jgi:tetratricopeptide (TPR) repeat protein
LDAFQHAFGKPLEEAVKDLRGYLNRLRPVTVDAAAEAPVVSAETSRVAEIDATLLRAGLALRTSHPDLAQRLFEQAAREHPGTPAAEAGMGTLALASGDKDAARRHLERAIELGSTEADAWFEYAMLERESGADRERVEQLLGKTVALNPNFAEAHFLLGVRATDDRQYDAAVEHLEAAVHVLPRQSSFWHALAYALDKQGRRADAVQAARRAVLTATDTTQERMAQALLDGLLHP